MSRRGTSLASVCLLTLLCLLLVLTLGQAIIFQQRFVVHSEDWEQARNQAAGTIYQAIASLADDDEFQRNCDWSSAHVDSANYARLSFDADTARNWQVPVSVNNLARTSSVPGPTGKVVPAGTAQLFAVARCGTVTVRLECLYYRPPYPRGVIASGPIQLVGSEVTGLSPKASFPGRWVQVPLEDRAPCHVFSNAPRGVGLNLGPACSVSGNAGAVSEVRVDPSAHVGGGVQVRGAPQEVPRFPIATMVERVAEVAGLYPYQAGKPVDDFVTVPNPLTVTGDLVLDGGTLAVRGGLTVTGAVRGRGLILVQGVTEIQGGADFAAGQNVAILSQGKIELQGRGRDHFFQGLLYSEGSVDAERLSVLGGVVSRSERPEDGVKLTDVQLISSAVHISTRQGLPLIESVSDDTVRFFFSVLHDPEHPGKKLFYGKAVYCESMQFGDETPHTTAIFGPDGERWTFLDGSPSLVFPYDGSRQRLIERMEYFLGRYGESTGNAPRTVARYLDLLTKKVPDRGAPILEVGLNQVVNPIEQSRVLYWNYF